MTCNCGKFIYIFKGDDTNWNNERFLKVTVTSEIDISSMTAKFILGSFSQSYPLTTGQFEVSLSRAVTGAYANGPINGVIQILDEEQRIRTITNTIPFYVTNHVIDEQDVDYNCNVSPNSPIEINVNVGGGGGRAEWGFIGGNIEDQEDLQEALAAKVSKSGDTMTGPLSFGDFSISTDDGLARIEGTQYGLRVDTTTGLGAALLTANGLGDVITSLNVQSTYSATGMDPVNGYAVASAISGKQDTLTQAQQDAVDSGIDSAKVGQIATNTSDISTINGKIPAQASTENQLADKNFVNSSIATNTANFIGTFNSVAELEAYSGTLTNNDYAFVVGTDSDGNTVYDRYKYNGETEEWIFEYELNNSSFTAAQWAAINSGITDTAVTQIGTNTTNIGTLTTDKQPKTLATPITVEGTSQTTVENALGAINTLAGKGIQNKSTASSSLTVSNNNVTTTATYAVVIDPAKSSATTGKDSVALGYNTGGSYANTTAMGYSASAGAIGSTAIGNSAYASGGSSASQIGATSVGQQAVANWGTALGAFTQTSGHAVAVGRGYNSSHRVQASAYKSIAIGIINASDQVCEATAEGAIQLGQGSNSTANTLQVYTYPMLDGTTGKIPNARLNLDSALDTSSTNPVENQAVANALNSKITYAMIIREW